MRYGTFLMVLALWLPGNLSAGPPRFSSQEIWDYVLPELRIESADLEGALSTIVKEYEKGSKKPAPFGISVNGPVTDAQKRGLALTPSGKKILLDATGMTIEQAMKAVGAMSGFTLTIHPIEILGGGLIDTFSFSPVADSGVETYSNTYSVAPDFPKGTALWHDGAQKQGLKELFERVGIPFPKGTGVQYKMSTSTLIVQQTKRNHTLIPPLVKSSPIQTQVMITTKLVHLPQHYLKEARTLTTAEYEAMRKEWAATKGGDIYPVPKVVARNWQKAMLDLSQQIPYPAGKEKDGKTVYENYSAGLQIDITAGMSGTQLEVKGQVRLNTFKDRTLREFVLKLGQREDWKGHRKENLDPRAVDFSGKIPDGGMLAVPCAKSTEPEGQVIAFFQVDLVDPAGKLVREKE